ncbi:MULTISPECIES: hypothetical protein [Acinetobacter]|uniref:hypothetical protein n=1 Tax=Acinetobacter TaxID=469 RepID=UPI0002CDD35B|nr:MULTISPECIES: hypothetical protein [Acinetobacter]ENW90533.1 hypothetical protein F905_00556 [Acinetobacter sp. CIP 53.82]MBA0154549.1 hypothetical protein [Acinetobacter indicus]
MFEDETVLAKVVRKIGGQVKAGEACGVTAAVIGRWIKQQHLPRTDYTGETDYAGALAEASDFLFSREEILSECNPANVKGRKMELGPDE